MPRRDASYERAPLARASLASKPAQAPVRLSLPLDQLLSSSPTTPADFARLLTAQNWHSAACRVAVRQTGGDAVGIVANSLNAHVVERAATSCSMHATTASGEHVCVLVKTKSDKLKVDIKATSAALAQLVADELPCLDV